MKITVITPYKNAEGWIARCVKSLKKNKGDFEFILVNDKSKDKGESIAKKTAGKDPRFVFLKNEHKAGVSGARNTGLDRATGEWITFLDADDEMLPGSYEIYCMVIRADDRAKIHQMNHQRYYVEKNKTAVKHANGRGTYDMSHLPMCWWGVWNKLYSADLLKEIRFKEGMQYGEDEIFNIHCLAADDYIHHASTTVMTVRRWFDNKQSLAHACGKKELIRQAHALEELLQESKNPKVRKLVLELLAEHWGSGRYRDTFA